MTGGASGIGLATARALYAQGASVALADINAAGLEAAAEQVRQSAPGAAGQVITVKTDVTDDTKGFELPDTFDDPANDFGMTVH